VNYSKATLHWATAQWEGYAVVNDTVAQQKQPLAPAADELDRLFGRARTPAGVLPPIHGARGSHRHRMQLASALLLPDRLRGGGSGGSDNPPPRHSLCDTDIGFFTALLKAQSDAQIAINKANHRNFIAFHTAISQALAAKGSDKDFKLTAAKKRILQACAGKADEDSFVPEPVFQEMDTKAGTAEALGQILRRHLKSIPLSPHKTNIYTIPQLIAMVKGMNFSANCDRMHAGCTKGITPFATLWRLFEEMNEYAAEELYFEASTVKLVADIRKHVAGTKVELPTTFMGLIRVLNNYSRLVEVLFGAECDHLAQVLAIRGGLEDHEMVFDTRLTPSLILHLMWRIHYDARQFFGACEGWEDGEALPGLMLRHMVTLLVDDCLILETLTCLVGAFLGRAASVQPGKPTMHKVPGTRTVGLQPSANTAIPPLCQKAVGAFNKAYPTLTISDLCRKGGIKFSELQTGKKGVCLNFGFLG
jgi:hypothetical protein